MDFAKLMGVFAVPALITVVLSIMPNNVIAVYSGGLAALAMGAPMKRWTSALVTGGIAALLIVYGAGQFANTYENFLLLLSYWIAPWLGVIISDHFFTVRRRLAGEQGRVPTYGRGSWPLCRGGGLRAFHEFGPLYRADSQDIPRRG